MLKLEKSVDFIKDENKLLRENLNVKLGMDPTSPNLHLGHYVLLKQARNLQDQGHKVFLIVGDFTAQIGDPSGKNKLRPKLSIKDITVNSQTYYEQAMMVLDPNKTQLVYNSKWLSKISMMDMMEIMSKNTVQQITAREDFSKRMDTNVPIYLHELMYPIMQGFDSVEIAADIELGGTDQLFNLNMGRDMQRWFNQEPQMIATFPLLVGLDGENKMSKSLANEIGFMDSPKDKFGKTMSISDETMENWIKVLDVFDTHDKQQLASEVHPLERKKMLATKIVTAFHGIEIANKIKKNFINQFSKKSFKDIEKELSIESIIVEKGTNLNKLIKDLGMASSNQDGLRKIQQGAVKIDNIKQTDNILIEEYFKNNEVFVIQVGKKQVKKVIFSLQPTNNMKKKL